MDGGLGERDSSNIFILVLLVAQEFSSSFLRSFASTFNLLTSFVSVMILAFNSVFSALSAFAAPGPSEKIVDSSTLEAKFQYPWQPHSFSSPQPPYSNLLESNQF